MSKVLLVYPNLQMINLLPGNIGILIANLKAQGHEVELFDATFYRIHDKSIDDIRADYLQVKPIDYSLYGIHYKKEDVYSAFTSKVSTFDPDLIAITIVEDTKQLALSLLTEVCWHRSKVIAGGVAVIISPYEYIRNPSIDIICIGEGEITLPMVASNLDNLGCVKGIWYKNEWTDRCDWIEQCNSYPLVDINSALYPDYSLFEPERFYRPMQGKVYRMIPFETDRGCPYSCTFCCAETIRKIYRINTLEQYYRKKSTDRIINELKYLIDKYDIQYVYFTTETFFTRDGKTLQDLSSRYNNEIGLPFWCQARVESLTENNIRLIRDMGCDRLSIGIEQGTEWFRKTKLNKPFTNADAIKAFGTIHAYDIKTTTNNIIGFPGETRGMIFDTIELNRKINPDSVNCFTFVPFKGTPLADKVPVDDDRSLVHSSQSKINNLLKVFPMYIKFGEERYPEIKQAETDDAMFKKLSDEYKKTFWGYH